LYLSDPDGNGTEFYWDRPKELWPRDTAGQIEMFTQRLDLENLLAEL
jgi:catechol 2,3-dioxygenase